jgi:hypothetical protein
MTRQEIADYLGLTIETVSRSLTKLKRRGMVSIDKLDEGLHRGRLPAVPPDRHASDAGRLVQLAPAGDRREFLDRTGHLPSLSASLMYRPWALRR